jgi:pyridoxal phosphate enzyme (YggS family)
MMEARYRDIEKRIQAACDRAGRNREEITLIAVSKTKPAEMVEEAYRLGIRNFGENKVQELISKQEQLSDNLEGICWHLIGHLQRNKVKQVIGRTVLIHSVDSLRLGLKIEEEAAAAGIVCDVLVQVNIAEEETKYGVSCEEVLPLLLELLKLSHIRIRGLMAIPPFTEDPEKNRKYFCKLRELFIDIKTKNIDNGYMGKFARVIRENPQYDAFIKDFDILSMGMTGDYEVAIEEGATMVRIGTGIFGERIYSSE